MAQWVKHGGCLPVRHSPSVSRADQYENHSHQQGGHLSASQRAIRGPMASGPVWTETGVVAGQSHEVGRLLRGLVPNSYN